MAGGATVGIRCPNHPVALDLLRAAAVPIAAPSANLFGHVSPTCPAHVVSDLGHHPSIPLTVLDGGATCSVGIESTVARVQPDAVTVLRHGAVSVQMIRTALADAGITGVAVTAVHRAVTPAETPGEIAPGQLLTHYAPSVPAFLVKPAPAHAEFIDPASPGLPAPVASCVVIDFAGMLAPLRAHALAYKDMAPDGRPEQASRRLYESLRWTETIEGAQAVLLAQPSREIAPAVMDRLFRAASGREIEL
eukprot:gnl/Ergobibamus_cyprinoides/427.p1 GENE.gnl/Ergobibamus_cyprinoides/427~~gnl/Ergobibamus_cyprinoides/427.p1  ORF type:complete len:249 (+),score=35.41 gnl/Ergobibamus_cyprinoides/427:357-1103(+)